MNLLQRLLVVALSIWAVLIVGLSLVQLGDPLFGRSDLDPISRRDVLPASLLSAGYAATVVVAALCRVGKNVGRGILLLLVVGPIAIAFATSRVGGVGEGMMNHFVAALLVYGLPGIGAGVLAYRRGSAQRN